MSHKLLLPLLGLSLSVSPALAQWWWPPQMEVRPSSPDPRSDVVLRLSGDWPDRCPPVETSFRLEGNEIDIDATSIYSEACWLTVITPWSEDVFIGRLPVGTYAVYATHYMLGPTTGRELVGTFIVEEPAACYANCDGSTTEPILTVDDFTCFINEFAGAQHLTHEQQIESYANCDGSTTAPVLTVDDFTCFINAFAAGCP